MKLGKAIKYIRIFHGMSIKELTVGLNTSSTGYISDLERGKKEVSLKMVKKYSEVFNIPTFDIIKIAEELENLTPRIVKDSDKADVIISWIGLMP